MSYAYVTQKSLLFAMMAAAKSEENSGAKAALSQSNEPKNSQSLERGMAMPPIHSRRMYLSPRPVSIGKAMTPIPNLSVLLFAASI